MTNLKILQKKVDDFVKKNKLNKNIEIEMLDLISEVGELSKELLKSTEYGTKKRKITDNTKSEFGDVLFVLIRIANEHNINLDEALELVLEKYKKRLKKGGVGSENQ